MQHINTIWLHLRQGSHETSLKRSGSLAAAVTFDPPLGRVVHLNSNGDFEMGQTNSVLLAEVPFVLDRPTDSPDVSVDSGNPATDADAWVLPNLQNRRNFGICLLDAYELEISEFAPEADVGVYELGQPLTATPSNTVAATGGRITKGTLGTTPVLGIVSQKVGPVEVGGHRNMLGFYSYFFPRLT